MEFQRCTLRESCVKMSILSFPSPPPSPFSLSPSLYPPPHSHTHAVHDAYSAVSDKMQRMVVNHANRFELIREAFNVPLKKHEDIQDEIKGSILDMVENFSGDITVKGTLTVGG